MCRALHPRMQPTLRAQVHKLHDRLVNHDTLEQPVVDVEVRDSPSARITGLTASAVSEGEQELDDGDRADGENWVDAATERALENLPVDSPLLIEDEPTSRHKPITKG